MAWHAMQCQAMPCHGIAWHGMAWRGVAWHAAPRHALPCPVLPVQCKHIAMTVEWAGGNMGVGQPSAATPGTGHFIMAVGSAATPGTVGSSVPRSRRIWISSEQGRVAPMRGWGAACGLSGTRRGGLVGGPGIGRGGPDGAGQSPQHGLPLGTLAGAAVGRGRARSALGAAPLLGLGEPGPRSRQRGLPPGHGCHG